MKPTQFSTPYSIIEQARTARRLPPVWLAVILAVAFIFMGQFLGAIPFALLLGLGLMPEAVTPLGQALYLLILFIVTLVPTGILLVLYVTLVERRPLRTLGLETPGALPKLLRGLAVGVLLFSTVVGLIALPAFLETRSQPFGFPLLILGSLLVLPGWLLQSSLEELVVRGWLMPVIGARSNRMWLALLISSILFALMHLLNPGITLLSTVNIALAGLLFGLLVLWEGGIWGAMGLHTAWNWVQGSVFGFPVSGNLFQSPSVWKVVENGPDGWTGGVFGPEGGLAATLVLLAACALLGWLIHRKNAKRAEQP